MKEISKFKFQNNKVEGGQRLIHPRLRSIGKEERKKAINMKKIIEKQTKSILIFSLILNLDQANLKIEEEKEEKCKLIYLRVFNIL